MDQSVALPWGRPVDQEFEATRVLRAAACGNEDISRGSRIEVLWQLSDEEGGSVNKWWGAELLTQPVADDQDIWTVRYDASDGFEPEESTVRLLPTGELHRQEDCHASERVLSWRRDGEVSEDEEEGDEPMNLKDLVDEHESMEREMGQTMDQAAMEHLRENLDPSQQRTVVAGFRDFVDHFKSHLDELLQSKDAPADYIVTSNDVQNIVATMKK